MQGHWGGTFFSFVHLCKSRTYENVCAYVINNCLVMHNDMHNKTEQNKKKSQVAGRISVALST